MQHKTQGELIIVAGNERICIYRTDTARLVLQGRGACIILIIDFFSNFVE